MFRPFSGCQEFLTAACISTYFVPIMSITKNYLLNLSDAELKKESKSELKNDQISCILTTMKRIARQCSEKDGKFDVSDLRLEMILRLLRVSSFNGKMNALIEINKILQSSSNFDTLSCADAIPPDKLAVRAPMSCLILLMDLDSGFGKKQSFIKFDYLEHFNGLLFFVSPKFVE